MGSYWHNKFLQKRWIRLKQELQLTADQQSVLIGSLLGDGTLRLGERAINVNFKVEHGLRQKEYVLWKYTVLKNWVFTEPKLRYRYHQGDQYPKSWWFRTIRHPLLTDYWRNFYTKGKKVIPKSIGELLDPLALAVWILDDGCYQREQIDISTYAFSLKEIHRLQDALRKKFNLISRYYKDRDIGYRMYFSREMTKHIVKLINSYVISSMQYKIGLSINPVTTDPDYRERWIGI